MSSSKDLLSHHIPVIFPNKFPHGYINNVDGWGISATELHSKLPDGTYKLLTLDIDFGSECSLACPHCFRKSKLLNDPHQSPLSYEELLSYIKEAKELGLKSVKVLGAGEPFQIPELLPFLEDIHKLNIKAAIFTKGHVLGSDELTAKYFGKYGLIHADQLADKLRKMDVSILLGFNSFKSDVQEAFVGGASAKVKDYVILRNKALIRLVNAGFNEYVTGKATCLAMIAAPIKPENVEEIFEIYEWGRRRNIYVLSCPTTFSGLGKAELIREHEAHEFNKYIKDLEDLYVKIFSWNISNNLMTIKQFIREGCSLYPGCHPCNQVAAGFYITLKGKIIRCPGRDDTSWVIDENIRGKKLKDVWRDCQNYKLAANEKKFNYRCIARDTTFFKSYPQFYQQIKKKVLSGIKK